MKRIIIASASFLSAASLIAHERALPHLHTSDEAVDITSIILFGAVPLFAGAIVYVLRAIRGR